MLEFGTVTLHAVDLCRKSSAVAMSDDTKVIILALFCAVISLTGLVFVVPWGYIWRSWQNRMAARRANTGMKETFIQALPSLIYGKATLQLTGLSTATDCAICTEEFVEGVCVRVLPNCNHRFHMECIDKWLRSHSSCPTCRHCLRPSRDYEMNRVSVEIVN